MLDMYCDEVKATHLESLVRSNRNGITVRINWGHCAVPCVFALHRLAKHPGLAEAAWKSLGILAGAKLVTYLCLDFRGWAPNTPTTETISSP
jgi:hypothetical protein